MQWALLLPMLTLLLLLLLLLPSFAFVSQAAPAFFTKPRPQACRLQSFVARHISGRATDAETIKVRTMLLLRPPPIAWMSTDAEEEEVVEAFQVNEKLNNESKMSVNKQVREFMSCIRSHFVDNDDNPNSWKKVRRYLYSTTNTNQELTLTQVEQVLEFLESNFGSGLAKHIIQSSPRILRKSVRGTLKPTHAFLQSLWGPDMLQEALYQKPVLILSRGFGTNGQENAEVEQILSGLGVGQNSIAKLKKSAPFVFTLPTEKVTGLISFIFQILQEASLSDSTISRSIGRLILSHPSILNLNIGTNLQPRLELLASKYDLSKKNIAMMVKASASSVFGLSVGDNLFPTIDFLFSIVDDRQALQRCLQSHPQILSLSLGNIRSKVAYFDAIDRLDGNRPVRRAKGSSLATRVAVRSPSVFSLSLRGNIVPTVEFLASVWGVESPQVSFDEKGSFVFPSNRTQQKSSGVTSSLASLLGDYPSILTFSLEGNIQPTIRFLNRTGYITLAGDWRRPDGGNTSNHSILGGRYIAASLFNRLLPRWHYYVANIPEHNKYQGSYVKKPALHMLALLKDDSFCKQFGFDLKDYTNFRSKETPNLKFSSQFDTWIRTGRPIDSWG